MKNNLTFLDTIDIAEWYSTEFLIKPLFENRVKDKKSAPIIPEEGRITPKTYIDGFGVILPSSGIMKV